MSKPVSRTQSLQASRTPSLQGSRSVSPGASDKKVLHIRAIGAMGPSADDPLLKPETGLYYVKMSLCEKTEKGVVAVSTANPCKSPQAEGPKPIFETGSKREYLFRVNLLTHAIAVELKEDRLVGHNRVVGTAVLNTRFLSQLVKKPQLEVWIPLRLGASSTPTTALVRLLLSIPELHGGAEAVPEAVKVVGTSMSKRKLEVTVYNASIPKPHHDFVFGGEAIPNEGADVAPEAYVTIHTFGSPNDAETKHTTAVSKSYFPEWNETFELFQEVSRCKALVLKLKDGRPAFGNKVLGQLTIPLSFYLASHAKASGEKTEAWENYTLSDPKTGAPVDIKMEVRLTIEEREDEELHSFFRTESKEAAKPSISRTASLQANRLTPRELEDIGTTKVVDDDDDDILNDTR